jgi:DHA1 family bicyclomycin/chloramphenicol resistance-like MFS transporter
MVRDLYEGDAAARFFAMTMAVNGLAPILAPIIGGQILNFTTWRGVFVLLTAIGLALFGAALFGLEETLPKSRRRTGGIKTTLLTFRRLLLDMRFVGYALSAGLAFAAMFAYIAGSPFALENIYGVSPQQFSLLFASNALGIICTSQISGRLVGRVHPRKLLKLGISGSLAGGLLLLVVMTTNIGLWGVLPAFFLVVASIGFIAPNAAALALADHASVAGSASALIGVLQYIIGAAITPLAGLGGSSTAEPLAILIALLSSSAFIVFVTMTRPAPSYQ